VSAGRGLERIPGGRLGDRELGLLELFVEDRYAVQREDERAVADPVAQSDGNATRRNSNATRRHGNACGRGRGRFRGRGAAGFAGCAGVGATAPGSGASTRDEETPMATIASTAAPRGPSTKGCRAVWRRERTEETSRLGGRESRGQGLVKLLARRESIAGFLGEHAFEHRIEALRKRRIGHADRLGLRMNDRVGDRERVGPQRVSGLSESRS
jgi:hypothetical protein